MTSDASQVVILSDDSQHGLLHGLSAHHRGFPEVRGEGSTPKAAAERLAELLLSSLDSAPSDWRRHSIEQAIEDLKAFTERDR